MQNIVETELFHNVKTRIYAMVEKITNVDSVAIFATADLEGIVSLAFLESAMMDAKIPYSRKILPSTHNQPKGENYDFSSNASLIISIEQYEDTWAMDEIDDKGRCRICLLYTSPSPRD